MKINKSKTMLTVLALLLGMSCVTWAASPTTATKPAESFGGGMLGSAQHVPPGFAAPGGMSGSAQPATATRPAEKSWEDALNTNIPEMSFVNTSLKDALTFYGQLAGLNIVPRWSALKAAGIEPTATVTLKLSNVRLEQALNQTLMELSLNAKLDYMVQDNILVISTSDDLAIYPQVKLYNVGDLVDGPDPAQSAKLVEMITTSIDPASWAPSGTIGSIQEFRGALTIRQTFRNHVEIEKLLQNLRKTVSRTPTAQVRQAEIRTKLVSSMKDACFDTQAMGIVALGGLRAEIPQQPQELAQQLETLLSQTKSVGLRNAIRLTLKDLYLEMGSPQKAQEQFQKMLKESDEALQYSQPPGTGNR